MTIKFSGVIPLIKIAEAIASIDCEMKTDHGGGITIVPIDLDPATKKNSGCALLPETRSIS